MKQIQIQNTPNPQALKFILASDVISEGRKVTYVNKLECPNVPLASALFDLAGTTTLHFFENVITVTKDDSREWPGLVEDIKGVIGELLDAHRVDFEVIPQKTRVAVQETEEVKKINAILDRTIRPGLQSDGGDLRVLKYENNQVHIQYEGACGGCPSSSAGTLYAIEGILKDEFNPEISVVSL